MRFRFRDTFLNPVSLSGAILAVICFGASTVLLLVDLFEENANPYTGILTFFVFPGLMGMSLLVAVLAMVHEARRRKRLALLPPQVVKRVVSKGRYFGLSLVGVTLLFLLLSSVGGYRAYEFTDSVNFCGKICHGVMAPEYTTYRNSPHARVKCVECHVGEGAQWYVKAKLSGLYQVYATLADKFPRPIPTPIANLRPAQETCEKCHWPEKFWGAQLSTRIHHGYDFANTRREVLMLVKIGGGGSGHGASTGIHWHMNISNKVEYIARDSKRLDIPWVRVTHHDGTVREYADTENPLTVEEIKTLPRRRMDCMDCHNRPTHIYLSPDALVDRLLAANRIDPGIPHLKKIAVEMVARDYPTPKQALDGIRTGLLDAFRKRYPKVARAHERGLLAAAAEIQKTYPKFFFPAMKASWEVYPNHIGHFEFPGCFRCHSGRHATRDGKILSQDCNICHDFVARHEDNVSMVKVPSKAAYIHPWRDGHDQLKCWECHTGKSSPYRTCTECHDREEDAPMQFACAACHQPLTGPDFKPVASCTRCHGMEEGEFHAAEGHRNCVACHEAHTWKTDVPGDCRACHADFMKTHNPGQACRDCHEFDDVDSDLVAHARPR